MIITTGLETPPTFGIFTTYHVGYLNAGHEYAFTFLACAAYSRQVENDDVNDPAGTSLLTDKELLKQFKEVELLNAEDKHIVKIFIDAFLTKRHIQEYVK